MWQWKDDATKIVPKLSYVKSFEPWGWIVGTGIYLDDIEEEIKELKNSLLIISLIIAFIIASILFYVVRQSLMIEMKRQKLTAELHKSKQKYKTLVEASNEGTLMFLNKSIIFSNSKFRELCGFSQSEISKKKIDDLFTTSWDKIHSGFSDTVKSFSFESSLICFDGIFREVILSISKVEYAKTFGYIISTKEVSKKDIAVRESDKFSGEIKTSLLLMKQPIKHMIQSTISCPAECSIQDAASKMERLKKDFLLVKQNNDILGIVTSNDISNRAVAKNSELTNPVSSIMTAPLSTISESARLNEALLMFSTKKVSHLVTIDDDNAISGVIAYNSIVSIQHNTLSFLLHEIDSANTVEDLTDIHQRVPAFVHALSESNENT
jgi:PAS domain S-box-containing protein